MSILEKPRSEARQTNAANSRPPKKLRVSARSTVAVNGLLVLGSLYMILPILWLVLASLKNVQDLYSSGILELGNIALLDNLIALFQENDGIFAKWMLNSFLYAGIGAVVGGLISVMAGYAFDKFKFRGRSKLFGFVLVGVLIPNTATVLPLYMLFSTMNLTNSIWSIILPALCNPFSVYLARIFSQSYIPDETLEASRMDGAGPIRTFVSIAVPMIGPGFVTIALFQFVAIWNNYMLPLVMLNTQELFPVSLGMALWQGYTSGNPEYSVLVITGALMSVIPLLLAFTMLQRFWKSGLSAGAVK
ncbi:carbohydrate ABC transporter permease [Arthrobacter sp. TS-15]|uniref:carbohydrate ABC transporter permease n=1 Tax=Arthrobacter sp. TS-15 TaxID=2510797 RepID=UPI00115F74DF|nr:carbohydrate ABC transporter permease [Arthrobacter sp. TS-15]TQS91364.1 carbohydrate ABC transporter permease [Arthrobacter sp. TS-15]